MALGKKKKVDEAREAAEDAATLEPVEELADDAYDASVLEEEAPEAAASGAADNVLLSMFQTTEMETEDLSALIELAGDVELADVLEDLQTVAAAMGIVLGTDEEYEEEAAA